MASIECVPEEYVLRRIQDAYLTRKVRKSRDCVAGMARDGLFEADVEKVFMDATLTGNTIAATGEKVNNPTNTRYVIYGMSTKGVEVCCKFSSNHHPGTNDFIDWVLTSFESK
jgi:hypothetical protein